MSFNNRNLEKIKEGKEAWEEEYKKLPKRDVKFTTVSGMDVPPLVIPADLNGSDYVNDLSFPGSYPFTRGVCSTMYHGKLWTMRQFAARLLLSLIKRSYQSSVIVCRALR